MLDIDPWYSRFSLDPRAEMFNFEDYDHVQQVNACVLLPIVFQRMAFQIERRIDVSRMVFERMALQSLGFRQ